MDDLISRQAAIDAMATWDWQELYLPIHFKQLLEDLPSVSTENTGRWIEIAKYSDGKHKIECSECKSHIFDRGHANSFIVKNKYKYCPNCGCRMVEPQERSDKE